MRLFCEKGPIQGQRFDLQEHVVYRIGREPYSEEDPIESILLESPSVSKNHCEIFYDQESSLFAIRDLKSFNGIRVNKNKVVEAFLNKGDRIDVGEFRFRLEEDPVESTVRQFEQTSQVSEEDDKALEDKQKVSLVNKSLEAWNRLDYRFKLFGVLGLVIIVTHWMTFTPMMKETQKNVFRQSIRVANEQARRLATTNENLLAAGQVHLLNCGILGQHEGVLRQFILDEAGSVLCPLGADLSNQSMVQRAVDRKQFTNSCDRGSLTPQETCTVVVPVEVNDPEAIKARIAGFAVTIYVPIEVFDVEEKFEDLRYQTLTLSVLLMFLAAFGLYYWLKRGVKELTDDVHLLYTGTAQNVETPNSFAAFADLSEEINRLFTKVNQGFSSEPGSSGPEASFLQQIMEQVFLLEDRALMAVDSDNHIVAISDYLPDIVPLHDDVIGVHVTEAVADTHLQSELMTFLNEVSSGQEALDKALSMSDRVLQSRGLPLWVNEEHVGSIVIF